MEKCHTVAKNRQRMYAPGRCFEKYDSIFDKIEISLFNNIERCACRSIYSQKVHREPKSDNILHTFFHKFAIDAILKQLLEMDQKVFVMCPGYLRKN